MTCCLLELRKEVERRQVFLGKSWKVEKRGEDGTCRAIPIPQEEHGDCREWCDHPPRSGAHQGIGQSDNFTKLKKDDEAMTGDSKQKCSHEAVVNSTPPSRRSVRGSGLGFIDAETNQEQLISPGNSARRFVA